MSEFELAETYVPEYDVSDAVAVVIRADAATTWDALMRADLIAVGRRRPLVGVFGAVRALPELVVRVLRGERVPKPPRQLTLLDTTRSPVAEGGWVLLGERPGEELALGLVGRFWRPVITYAAVTREGFRDFAEPGYAKTVYALAVRGLDDRRSMLSAVMRTTTTDQDARRWFRRYWTCGVGSGAHVLVNGLLDVVREDAERAVGTASGGDLRPCTGAVPSRTIEP